MTWHFLCTVSYGIQQSIFLRDLTEEIAAKKSKFPECRKSHKVIYNSDVHGCHMGTAIEHPVPHRVKPSFVIFYIRALLTLSPGRQSGMM